MSDTNVIKPGQTVCWLEKNRGSNRWRCGELLNDDTCSEREIKVAFYEEKHGECPHGFVPSSSGCYFPVRKEGCVLLKRAIPFNEALLNRLWRSSQGRK